MYSGSSWLPVGDGASPPRVMANPLAGIPTQRPRVLRAQHGCGTATDSHRLPHLFPAAPGRLHGVPPAAMMPQAGTFNYISPLLARKRWRRCAAIRDYPPTLPRSFGATRDLSGRRVPCSTFLLRKYTEGGYLRYKYVTAAGKNIPIDTGCGAWYKDSGPQPRPETPPMAMEEGAAPGVGCLARKRRSAPQGALLQFFTLETEASACVQHSSFPFPRQGGCGMMGV